ncbi:MAG: MFS transporter [Proteobacteria bacterium]|nr:MFS transporter [Pseudomonadota bacterium]
MNTLCSDEKKTLWAICLVTFLWSVASLMVFSLLPTFLTEELNVSKTTLGFIEGIAIFMAFLAKVFSGVLSDIFKTRRSLIIAGTIGTAAIKPLFALSSGVWSIFWARTLDRLSKGVRSAPSDALIADISPKASQGTSYGMRYTLETAGFVVGGALASGIYALTQNYRIVFWCSVIPGICALIVLYRFVHDTTTIRKQVAWHWSEVRFLPMRYWKILGGTFILMQARFSEAFLNLRAKDYGWSVTLIPLLFVAYSIVCANTAWPMGKLADRTSRLRVFLIGLLVLIVANIIMIVAPNKWWIIGGFMLCGLHMGMTHGMLSALIAENTLSHLRGTAFAMYYLVTGIAVLFGNSIAGFLSEHFHGGAFYGGLIFTSLAALYFYKLSKENE